jgi:hypothetical protein
MVRIASVLLNLALISLVGASPLRADDDCGIVHKQRREPLGTRFWPLAEHGGKAFVDARTCLVARLEVFEEPVTLNDAMFRCAVLGQGGPNGDMGWQLPTMAELTSLDGEEWKDQRGEFAQFKIPPLTRSETPFWTTTKWLGAPDSLAVVEFSALTTVVFPLAETMKAGVWCVRGVRATGLK